MNRSKKIKPLIFAGFLSVLLSVAAPLPVGAQEKSPRALQQENERLHSEMETLKAELTKIRAAAEEVKPTADLSVSVLSAYIFRGDEMTRNSLVIQPSVTMGYKGFTANVWGNLDTRPYQTTAESLTKQKDSSNWTETDFTLSYSKSWGIVNLGGGYIYYANAGGNNRIRTDSEDQQELFLTVGLNTLLSPTLTLYKGIDYSHNWYALFGISHTFEFTKRLFLKLAASVSYLKVEDGTVYDPATNTLNQGRPKVNDDGNVAVAGVPNEKFNNLHDGILSVSLPIKVSQYMTITPTLSYIAPLSRDAKNDMRFRSIKDAAFDDRPGDFLVGGVTLSFSF